MLLQGAPSGKLLIPLNRRDVRVLVLLRGDAASAGHHAVAREENMRERRRMKEPRMPARAKGIGLAEKETREILVSSNMARWRIKFACHST